MVPNMDDIPVLLRGLTDADMRVLRPFEIHCGDYRRMLHGYRQRTGPFCLTWSALSVREKLDAVEDQRRRSSLFHIFDWLMANAGSSYRKFIVMQSWGVPAPMLFQIFSDPQYHGIKCTLWPTLYTRTAMCECHPRAVEPGQWKGLVHAQSSVPHCGLQPEL